MRYDAIVKYPTKMLDVLVTVGWDVIPTSEMTLLVKMSTQH